MNDEPTDAERAEAEALRRYLDGEERPPSLEIGATVGLIREAAPQGRARRDELAEARRVHRRRVAIWPIAVPAFAIAAALMLVFIPRAPSPLPSGPTPEQLAKAVRAVSGPAPLPERLEALHEVAAAARARLVATIAAGRPAVPRTEASLPAVLATIEASP